MSYANQINAIQAKYEKELLEFAKSEKLIFPFRPFPQLIKQISDLQFCFDELLGELGWGDEIAETGVDPLVWARNEIKNSKIEMTKLRARLATNRTQVEAMAQEKRQCLKCKGTGYSSTEQYIKGLMCGECGGAGWVRPGKCFYCEENKQPAKEIICQDCVDEITNRG